MSVNNQTATHRRSFADVAAVPTFRRGWSDAAGDVPFPADFDRWTQKLQWTYEYSRLTYAELAAAGYRPPLVLPLDPVALERPGVLAATRCPALKALNDRIAMARPAGAGVPA